jgi:hypothetical protein
MYAIPKQSDKENTEKKKMGRRAKAHEFVINETSKK